MAKTNRLGARAPGKFRRHFSVWGPLCLVLGTGSCAEDVTPQQQEESVLQPSESTQLPPTFEAQSSATYVSKVKNLLTGLPLSDEDLLLVGKDEAALGTLIDTWMKTPQFQAKMLRFFQNSFQQGQLSRSSLLEMAPDAPITDRMLGNITSSFPLTVWQLAMVEGRPFHEALTTNRFMLTPPLATLLAYLDNRHISDANRGTDYIVTGNPNFTFTLTNKSGPIPIEKTLNPADPLYMNWSLPAAIPAPCMDPMVYKKDTSRLFQFFLGSVGATTGVCQTSFGTTPQFADAEYDSWRMVKLRQPVAAEPGTPFYDLAKMRTAGELVMRVPRVGFFSTLAFFGNWATNPSNQARVTMNQALIVALGRSFDDNNNTVPITTPALDAKHSSEPACRACHETLDPMRQVFRQAYTLSYHEQKEVAQTSLPGVFAFDGVTKSIANPRELAEAMASHPRFAVAWTQKLCYWANSAPCSENDPEFQRVASVFASSRFDWKTLVRTLLTSPLVTGTKNTRTFADQGMTISVARRDQLCAAMSSRLGVTNLCSLGRAPGLTQLVPSDGYSRGGTAPVLATDPSLFYRAASEQLCRTFADSAVDATVQGKPSRFASKTPDPTIADMVQTVMAIPSSDARYVELRRVLSEHFAKAKATPGITATDAMKSTFVLACTSPTSISLGL